MLNKDYKYLDIITALFASLLIISNIASTRIIDFSFFSFDAGTLMFPLTYMFNDVLTEVYGFARSRRVIWIGFATIFIAALSLYAVSLFPPAAGWDGGPAWDVTLGQVPRIVLASFVAYLTGEFINSYALAKIKLKTKGKYLGFRLIASTAIGQVFDTGIFATIAFLGVLNWNEWLKLVYSNYIFKVGIEIIFLPLTYIVIDFFKKVENSDYYDVNTNFSPFKWNH